MKGMINTGARAIVRFRLPPTVELRYPMDVAMLAVSTDIPSAMKNVSAAGFRPTIQ